MKRDIWKRIILPILIGVASAVIAWFIMEAIQSAQERRDKEIVEPLYKERQDERIDYLEDKCQIGIDKDVEHDIGIIEISTKLDNMNSILTETRTDVKQISRSIIELKRMVAFKQDTTLNNLTYESD